MDNYIITVLYYTVFSVYNHHYILYTCSYLYNNYYQNYINKSTHKNKYASRPDKHDIGELYTIFQNVLNGI